MNAQALVKFTAVLALSIGSVFAQVSSSRKSPTSKFYVAEVQGFAQVTAGEEVKDITTKSIFDAEGTVIETKHESSLTVAMSNGPGVFFTQDTKLAINRFLQEPFSPNRTDIESEPSMSQTRTMLARGGVGICSGKLVASSTMIYDTPHGSVNILSQNTQKLAIEIAGTSTTVTLFEGSISLRGDKMAGGEAILPGQQAMILNRGLDQTPEIKIGPIPDDQRERLEDMVNGACQARKKVYFDTTETQTNTTELVPIVVNPANPAEIGTIVSPARVN